MKGAVLIIGSLLWENKENALKKEQGEKREKWRIKYLDIENKIPVKVPIRYGRKSSSRKCTYTMVFSNSVESLGDAFLVPFKNEITRFEQLKTQAINLAHAEGIAKKIESTYLFNDWGAVGILFNESFNDNDIIDRWKKEFRDFSNDGYGIEEEKKSILNEGELNFNIEFPEEIDYVLATPVKPELSVYPSIEEIAKAINISSPKYDTYARLNYNEKIRVKDDDKLMKLIS